MEPRLKFKIRNQTIQRVDNFFVVEKSRNYLYADFTFLTDDWEDAPIKTAIFEWKNGAKNVILENDSCLVPWEAIDEAGKIYVSVFGGDLITVSRSTVTVNKSGYKEGTKPQPPTPYVYEQLLNLVSTAIEKANEATKMANEAANNFNEVITRIGEMYIKLKKLEELVGNTSVTEQISQALKNFKISVATIDDAEEMLNDVFNQ